MDLSVITRHAERARVEINDARLEATSTRIPATEANVNAALASYNASGITSWPAHGGVPARIVATLPSVLAAAMLNETYGLDWRVTLSAPCREFDAPVLVTVWGVTP